MKSLMLKAMLILMATTVGTSIALAADVNCTPPASTDTSTHGILYKACTYGSSFAGCDSGQKINDACGNSSGTYLQEILNTFFLAAGFIAFLFLILGGIRYITSTGDSARIKSAKETILYAIIGLVVTFLAIPIADFVISQVT
jgi:hypothetical protein